MIDKSKLAMIVAAAALALTSPAFAQARQPAAHFNAVRAAAAAPHNPVTVDRNDPALTGGGSLGYNQMVEHGW